MEAFEPPKYIASLIAAVNDGAKLAQAGALLFMLVGLYLLATAFSASDEDLLLGRTVTISQIGVALPVSFSFAIAPLVFVFLHIYTLVRYDLLAANVRKFLEELRNAVKLESDRERCRHLLANVEFIVVLTAPRNSTLYSRFWTWLFRGIAAGFPVAVLLLVQINALRYQSDLIVRTQRIWLLFDLMALIWFFRRNALDGSVWPERRPARMRRWVGLLLLPLLIGAVNWVYLNTVPPEADARLVRYDQRNKDNPDGLYWPNPANTTQQIVGDIIDSLFSKGPKPSIGVWLAYAVANPLDLFLCPQLNWGCRFLRVDHRTLVDKVRDEKAAGILRMDISALANVLAQEEISAPGGNLEQKAAAERTKAMAAIEGVFLRERSLRFAVLDESRLYVADLIHADLRNASLTDADVSGARLSGALFGGSNLTTKQLESAASQNFERIDLSGLSLEEARLQNANLSEANLHNAKLGRGNLSGANLHGADLNGADLNGASLSNANLQGVDLEDVNLSGANLSGANLILAFLSRANLSSANLTDALLNGASLAGASLSGANLTGAHLSGTHLSKERLDEACGTGAKGLGGQTLKPCPER